MPEVQKDTVYFYKFNNYYNRQIKRFDTIEEYGDPLGTQTNCNFVHGDGINASFTFNKGTSLLDTPDYVIVNDYNSNISRWFVTNSFKNRSGQDSLTLRRDLIADFYNDVLKHSPCLIRKGYLDQTNPLIFNDEGVKYNKIKQEEIMIKDRSNCSYIIGFIANNAAAKATINGTIKANDYDYYFSDLSAFFLNEYVEGAGNTHTKTATHLQRSYWYALRFSLKNANNRYYNAEAIMNPYGYSAPANYTNTYASNISITPPYVYCNNVTARASNLLVTRTYAFYSAENFIRNLSELFLNNCSQLGNDYIKSKSNYLFPLLELTYEDLQTYNGKRIKIGNTIYDATVSVENQIVRNATSNADLTSGINTYVKPTNTQINNLDTYVSVDNTYNSLANADITVYAQTGDYYLTLTEASEGIKTEVKAANLRSHLKDQPYDMFVMINESDVAYKVGTTDFVSNHDVNMNMAQAIIQEYGDAAYDVQIVPFNPIQGAILADGTINWLNYDSVAIKNSADTTIGHYVMCSSADLKLTLDKAELKFNPEDYKKDFNLKQYRLCSPNQETVFDFSPAMNGGINTWEITANYRPYASYIKVQPTWNWLYGVDSFNGQTDFRGLVYNSTLCVTQLNDAWSNYVANNKNYQQLFDNQINTLTKSQEIQISALEDTLGWRSYTGMPISSIARVIGGMKDIDMQKELNNVALSKLNSDFKYQMDNIQSMPHSIKKLTNINGDTRVFPYIEVYSCSSTEEESFNLKMKYTGYTIMTTGYIWNYLKENEEIFIQADLIRLDLTRSEETADNHMAVEIASELEKGIYIIKESE